MPRTVIEDVIHVEGAVPEAMLVDELLKVLDTATMRQLRQEWELSLSRSNFRVLSWTLP